MKLPTKVLIAALAIFLAACASTTRFPISNVAPAAEIKAKTKVDKNNNNVVTVNAKNLASPDRVDPTSTAYVIWANTEENELINLGQLRNENAQTATLTTLTPYNINEIIITAEPQGSVSTPSGTEISRVTLNDPFGREAEMNSMQNNSNNNPFENDSEPFISTPDTTGIR